MTLTRVCVVFFLFVTLGMGQFTPIPCIPKTAQDSGPASGNAMWFADGGEMINGTIYGAEIYRAELPSCLVTKLVAKNDTPTGLILVLDNPAPFPGLTPKKMVVSTDTETLWANWDTTTPQGIRLANIYAKPRNGGPTVSRLKPNADLIYTVGNNPIQRHDEFFLPFGLELQAGKVILSAWAGDTTCTYSVPYELNSSGNKLLADVPRAGNDCVPNAGVLIFGATTGLNYYFGLWTNPTTSLFEANNGVYSTTPVLRGVNSIAMKMAASAAGVAVLSYTTNHEQIFNVRPDSGSAYEINIGTKIAGFGVGTAGIAYYGIVGSTQQVPFVFGTAANTWVTAVAQKSGVTVLKTPDQAPVGTPTNLFVAGNLTVECQKESDGNNCYLVNLNPAGATTPVVTQFTANPASITAGQKTTLSWCTTNATSVSIDLGIGTVPVCGSLDVSLSLTTIYTLTATGPGGSVTAKLTVNVIQPPPPATPKPLISSLTREIGLTPGPLALGGIASITGRNFTPVITPLTESFNPLGASLAKWPTELGGCRVSIGGVYAPIQYCISRPDGSGQINFRIPSGLPINVPLAVIQESHVFNENGGGALLAASDPVMVTLVSNSGALFSTSSNGQADTQLITLADGSQAYQVQGAGFGSTANSYVVPDDTAAGQVLSAGQVATPDVPVMLYVHDQTQGPSSGWCLATGNFVGLDPALVGVTDLVFQFDPAACPFTPGLTTVGVVATQGDQTTDELQLPLSPANPGQSN